MVYDIAIFGGGVVGCAILNKMTRLGKRCILFEKENDVATKTTKANSGIVHAGFDAKPHSLKARLNVLGNSLFPKLCSELNIDYKNNGAIVLSNNIDKVVELYKRGQVNGVPNLEILTREQLLKKVPNITDNIKCGLYAKTSGIVSPYMFTIALAEESVLNGADIVFNYEVKIVEKNNIDNFIISNGKNVFESKVIINAVGGNFNELSELIGGEEYLIEYRKGQYFLLDNSSINLTKYTLFPTPDALSKGVLISPTIDGNIIIGPTSSVTMQDDTSTTNDGLNEVFEKSKSMLNSIPFHKNIRVFAGVRTICGKDFIIEKSKKVSNLINICGICSPGLTSAPAIAEYVVLLLKFDNIEKPMKRRIPYQSIRNKSINQIDAMIKKDANNGIIICKCENVTKAEIINAINSPLRPMSVDGVKRRTRAGMGRCQGGFCLSKVMDLIAEYNNIDVEDVVKENKQSRIIMGNIKGKE